MQLPEGSRSSNPAAIPASLTASLTHNFLFLRNYPAVGCKTDQFATAGPQPAECVVQ
jgi:hypothetical protein